MDSCFVGQEYGLTVAGRRTSPYHFSQRKLRNVLYLPRRRDLPSEGTVCYSLVFDFGFDAGNSPLAPLATANDSVVLTRPLLVSRLTGFSNDATVPYLGYLLQFYTQHQGRQRQWFNKHLSDVNVVGTGPLARILRNPELLLPGDSIQCEVKNLNRTAAATKIQVVLYGTEFTP